MKHGRIPRGAWGALDLSAKTGRSGSCAQRLCLEQFDFVVAELNVAGFLQVVNNSIERFFDSVSQGINRDNSKGAHTPAIVVVNFSNSNVIVTAQVVDVLFHNTAFSLERVAVWDKQIDSEQPDNHERGARCGNEKPEGSRIGIIVLVGDLWDRQPAIL